MKQLHNFACFVLICETITFLFNKKMEIHYSTLSSSFMTEDAQLTPLLRLGAGACAGIIAMSATYPMDMVRGRLTVQVIL